MEIRLGCDLGRVHGLDPRHLRGQFGAVSLVPNLPGSQLVAPEARAADLWEGHRGESLAPPFGT